MRGNLRGPAPLPACRKLLCRRAPPCVGHLRIPPGAKSRFACLIKLYPKSAAFSSLPLARAPFFYNYLPAIHFCAEIIRPASQQHRRFCKRRCFCIVYLYIVRDYGLFFRKLDKWSTKKGGVTMTVDWRPAPAGWAGPACGARRPAAKREKGERKKHDGVFG